VPLLPLRTPRLRLREFRLEDAPDIMRLNAEPSTRRGLPSHVYRDIDEATQAMGFLIACVASPGDPRRGPYVLAVEHGQTRELLGHVGGSPLDGEVEVSYAIAEAWRGHGYGTEALACFCERLSAAFGLSSLIAVTALENARSRRLLERAGFVHACDETMAFQGTQRDVSRYRWRSPNLNDARV